ncbi:MAG: hypothetical protein ABI649_03510 [Gaiellaceae bacterium]
MVFSKRNAFIGWLVLAVGKPIAKRKAKAAARSATSKRGGAIFAGLAAAVGGLMFWRKRRSGDGPAES